MYLAWHRFQNLTFSISFLLLFPLFSMSLHGRWNSDSEDEDSGSLRSTTLFSRLEKAENRLASNYQRPSLLLELATRRAMRSQDAYAARRTSAALRESRCTCLSYLLVTDLGHLVCLLPLLH